jgi:hypothetical protein
MEVIVENGNKLEKKKARENRRLGKKLVEGDMRIVIEILLWENEARKNDWLKEKLVSPCAKENLFFYVQQCVRLTAVQF